MTVREILIAAIAVLDEMAPDVRVKCAQETFHRLEGLIQSLDTAVNLITAAAVAPPLGTHVPGDQTPTLAAPIPADLVVILQDLASSLRELRADLDQVKTGAA
jgi:hypothetical protein